MITKTRADEEAGKIIKRRLSWEAFYKLRPDLRPANENAVQKPREDCDEHA